MLCGNCKEGYDPVRHVPRILISCGHTFCQICVEGVLEKEMQDKKTKTNKEQTNMTIFDCFECGIPCPVNNDMGINALPKNQVLISAEVIQQQPLSLNESQELSRDQMNEAGNRTGP